MPSTEFFKSNGHDVFTPLSDATKAAPYVNHNSEFGDFVFQLAGLIAPPRWLRVPGVANPARRS